MKKNEWLPLISDTIIRIITFDYFFMKLIIRRFLKNSFEGSVLDLGCGTGVFAPSFNKNGYVGVDIDPILIDYAKKNHKDYKFLVGDVTKIRLKNKFDSVVIIGVMHHLNDSEARKFMETIKFHLKKNGRVLLLEAIPPIFKWNFLGAINRKMDRGAYIRKLEDYKNFIKSNFSIDEAYNQLGGVADYGVLILSKR